MPRPYCPSCPKSKLTRGRALHLDDPDYGKDFFTCKKCGFRFALDDPNLPMTPVQNPTIDRWIEAMNHGSPPPERVPGPKRKSGVQPWQAPQRDISPHYSPPPQVNNIGHHSPSLPPSPPQPNWDEIEEARRRERLQRILASPGISTLSPPSPPDDRSSSSTTTSPEEEARRDRLNRIARSPRTPDVQRPKMNLGDPKKHAEDAARRERLKRIAATPLMTPLDEKDSQLGSPSEKSRRRNPSDDDFTAVRRYTDDITGRLDDLIRKSPWQRPSRYNTPRASPRATPKGSPRAPPQQAPTPAPAPSRDSPPPIRQPSPPIGPDADDAAEAERMFGRAPGSDLGQLAGLQSPRIAELEREIAAERDRLLREGKDKRASAAKEPKKPAGGGGKGGRSRSGSTASAAPSIKWGADPAKKVERTPAMTPLPPSPEKKTAALPPVAEEKPAASTSISKDELAAKVADAVEAIKAKDSGSGKAKAASEAGTSSPVFG